MSPYRTFRFALLLTVTCSLLSAQAWGDPLAFSGTATVGDDLANFFFSGPDIGMNSAFPSFQSFLGLCAVNASCTLLSFVIPAASQFGFGFSGGSITGSLHADVLVGSLAFTGTAFIPSGTGSASVTAPVTFVGHLVGHQLLGPVGNPTFGPQLFELDLSGQGMGTLTGSSPDGSLFRVARNDYTYTGTAVVVPEPSAFLLLGSGLAALAGLARRKLLSRAP
jgi:hypothetical protein